MKTKQLFTIILILITVLSNYAQHTFSIVAVDPVTGEIGSAGATCISAEDGALAISDIILNTGAIHTQAYWHPTNLANANARMVAGDSPQEIIDWLIANDVSSSPTFRQYGIVDLNNGSPRSAAYTGTSTDDVKLHVIGLTYAIQGNILISEDVVLDMETAFTTTTGTLAERLMATMQAAKRPGADSRCLDFGVSSASAFLRVASPTDTDASYGNLSLDLNVWITGEVFEPIDALQDTFNETLSTEDNELESSHIHFYPNPTEDYIIVRANKAMITSYKIIDITGKIIANYRVTIPKNNLYLDLKKYKVGTYYLSVFNKEINLTTTKIIIK